MDIQYICCNIEISPPNGFPPNFLHHLCTDLIISRLGTREQEAQALSPILLFATWPETRVELLSKTIRRQFSLLTVDCCYFSQTQVKTLPFKSWRMTCFLVCFCFPDFAVVSMLLNECRSANSRNGVDADKSADFCRNRRLSADWFFHYLHLGCSTDVK